MEAAHNAKIDRSRYEIVRSLDRLNAWVARANEIGAVAVDTETSSLDPMQATLCGFSLALAENEACYVPLSHRQGGGKGGLFPGEIVPDQIDEATALAALKPLLENRGVMKIGQNLKFDVQMFALRGIELAPYDDTMLMSYVLDAGRNGHGLDELAAKYLHHRTIQIGEVAGSGRTFIGFARVLRDDLPCDPGGPANGTGWSALMTSRDGVAGLGADTIAGRSRCYPVAAPAADHPAGRRSRGVPGARR